MEKKNWKTQTKGAKVRIAFGDGKEATFTAGGRKRYLVSEEYKTVNGAIGEVMTNAEIRLADGTMVWGLLSIDETSSCEHWGTGIFTPSGQITFQDDPDFLTKLGKTSEQVFPYQYRYSAMLKASDHHIGEDGWSRTGRAI